MAFFNKYPYTDFHELNLDWFLSEFKKLVDQFLDLENAFKTLKEYIDEYFRNLDLQQEVNNYFNGLIDSGEIYDLLSNYFGANLVDTALYSLHAQVVPDRNNRFNPSIASEGMCIGTLNGRPVMMNGFINGTDDNNIAVWTYMDTGVVINTITLNAGHINSCAYNPENDHYYIACDGYGSPRNTLIELDITGAFYNEANIANRGVWGITYNQGKLYALLSGDAMAIVNPNDWNDYELKVAMGFDNALFTYQGICADDKYLYIFNGNRIANVAQGTINLNRISVYSHTGLFIKNIISEYPLEMEEGAIFDDELYIASNTGRAALIAKSDLYYKKRFNDLGFINDNIEVNIVANNLYIDEQYTDFFMNGTNTKPLSNLAWVILYLRNSMTRCNINIQNDIVSLTAISFRRYPQIIMSIAGNGHQLPSIHTNCKELYISNGIIEGATGQYSIEYYGARLSLDGITFGNPGTTEAPERLVFSTASYEFKNLTINQDATYAFYLLGNGYIRTLTINTSSYYKMVYGVTTVDRTFPIERMHVTGNLTNNSYLIHIPSDYSRTIDMHALRFPCRITHTTGTLTNLPTNVTLSKIKYVDVNFVINPTATTYAMYAIYYQDDATYPIVTDYFTN